MKRVGVAVLVVVTTFLLAACGGAKYEWPDSGPGSLLPQPDSKNGEIQADTEDVFCIIVNNVSEKQYEDYIKRCQENGFTVDSETTSFSYDAYNDEGYKLSLYYMESKESMEITLEAPRTFGEYRWPDSEIAGLLPVPKSNTGSMEWERSDGFLLYVSNMSIEDYNDYVDQCAGKGFDVDYDKGDQYYYASNEEGYSLALSYEGYNIMRLMIEKPDDAVDEQEDTGAVETEEPEASESTAGQEDDESPAGSSGSEEYIDGMRVTFKEAMDSYEAFFDEYCEFMKKYKDATDTSGMLTDYLEYLEKYTDTMEKLEKLKEEELNSEELKYYAEVTGRINQKLLEAAQ